MIQSLEGMVLEMQDTVSELGSHVFPHQSPLATNPLNPYGVPNLTWRINGSETSKTSSSSNPIPTRSHIPIKSSSSDSNSDEEASASETSSGTESSTTPNSASSSEEDLPLSKQKTSRNNAADSDLGSVSETDSEQSSLKKSSATGSSLYKEQMHQSSLGSQSLSESSSESDDDDPLGMVKPTGNVYSNNLSYQQYLQNRSSLYTNSYIEHQQGLRTEPNFTSSLMAQKFIPDHQVGVGTPQSQDYRQFETVNQKQNMRKELPPSNISDSEQGSVSEESIE
jgi:hypothetical protein